MLQILSVTAPIFLIIGLGFASARLRMMSQEQLLGMGRFVINLALPALVLKALTERPLGEVFEVQYLRVYGLASLAAYAAGFFYLWRIRGESASHAAILALGVSSSNSGFIGYPIVAGVVGAPAAVALALNLMVENLLMVPLALALCELTGRRGQGGLARQLAGTGLRLARNPVVLAIALGLALALFGRPMPAIAANAIAMLAEASAPVALFVIGGTLHGLKPGGLLSDAAQFALGKLLLHPLLAWLGFLLWPVADPALRNAGILFAAAPMLSILPLLGQPYGLAGRCAAALVAATLLSFFTLSLFVGVLHL